GRGECGGRGAGVVLGRRAAGKGDLALMVRQRRGAPREQHVQAVVDGNQGHAHGGGGLGGGRERDAAARRELAGQRGGDGVERDAIRLRDPTIPSRACGARDRANRREACPRRDTSIAAGTRKGACRVHAPPASTRNRSRTAARPRRALSRVRTSCFRDCSSGIHSPPSTSTPTPPPPPPP